DRLNHARLVTALGGLPALSKGRAILVEIGERARRPRQRDQRRCGQPGCQALGHHRLNTPPLRSSCNELGVMASLPRAGALGPDQLEEYSVGLPVWTPSAEPGRRTSSPSSTVIDSG